MAILCPYCRHSMTVKDAKPGKYKPKCAKCGKRFGLTIDHRAVHIFPGTPGL